MIEEVPFQGYACVRIVNGDGAELLVTVDRGPRIIAFQEPPESTGRRETWTSHHTNSLDDAIDTVVSWRDLP